MLNIIKIRLGTYAAFQEQKLIGELSKETEWIFTPFNSHPLNQELIENLEEAITELKFGDVAEAFTVG